MHQIVGNRPAPRRRGRIWKIVLIGVILAAIIEPIVMYRMLVIQRERRLAAEFVVPAATHQAATHRAVTP